MYTRTKMNPVKKTDYTYLVYPVLAPFRCVGPGPVKARPFRQSE